MAYPKWPAILMNADWQKKKGAISKMLGKTGVGEAMNAAKALFDKIEWEKMDALSILPGDRDIPIIRERQKGAKTYYSAHVVPARALVKKVCDAAEATAKKFKANKLVPASSTKHAEAVVKEADAFWITLKDNAQWAADMNKSFETMIALKEKNALDENKKLPATIENLEKSLKGSLKDMTSSFWRNGSDSPHQRCRSMCNAIRNIPALKAEYWSEWQTYGNEYHKDVVDGAKNENDLMKKKIVKVTNALAVFKANYKKISGQG